MKALILFTLMFGYAGLGHAGTSNTTLYCPNGKGGWMNFLIFNSYLKDETRVVFGSDLNRSPSVTLRPQKQMDGYRKYEVLGYSKVEFGDIYIENYFNWATLIMSDGTCVICDTDYMGKTKLTPVCPKTSDLR
jgi:hypothetical protein